MSWLSQLFGHNKHVSISVPTPMQPVVQSVVDAGLPAVKQFAGNVVDGVIGHTGLSGEAKSIVSALIDAELANWNIRI